MKSEKLLLNTQSIDNISEEIQNFLLEIGMESRNVTMLRLSIEDILIKWQNKFGEEVSFKCDLGFRFRRPYISLEIAEEEYNPLADEGEDAFIKEFSLKLLTNLGLCPNFSYKNGTNIISVNLKKKNKNLLQGLIVSVIVAIAIGCIGLYCPVTLRENILNALIEPVYNAFLSILSAVAGPLIFTSIVCGIYGVGDIATFGSIGKRMLWRFFLMSI